MKNNYPLTRTCHLILVIVYYLKWLIFQLSVWFEKRNALFKGNFDQPNLDLKINLKLYFLSIKKLLKRKKLWEARRLLREIFASDAIRAFRDLLFGTADQTKLSAGLFWFFLTSFEEDGSPNCDCSWGNFRISTPILNNLYSELSDLPFEMNWRYLTYFNIFLYWFYDEKQKFANRSIHSFPQNLCSTTNSVLSFY